MPSQTVRAVATEGNARKPGMTGGKAPRASGNSIPKILDGPKSVNFRGEYALSLRCGPRAVAAARDRSLPAEARIEGVAQGVAEQIESEHGEHDRGPGEEEDPPRAAGEVLVGIGEHGAPLGRRRLRAEPEKAERGGLEDRERDRERGLDDQGRQAVRNDVAQENAPAASAQAPRRDHEILLAQGEHGAAAQAGGDPGRDQADREERVAQAR